MNKLTEEQKDLIRKEILELMAKPYQGLNGRRKTPVSKSEARRREERLFNAKGTRK